MFDVVCCLKASFYADFLETKPGTSILYLEIILNYYINLSQNTFWGPNLLRVAFVDFTV